MLPFPRASFSASLVPIMRAPTKFCSRFASGGREPITINAHAVAYSDFLTHIPQGYQGRTPLQRPRTHPIRMNPWPNPDYFFFKISTNSCTESALFFNIACSSPVSLIS